jgi:Fe-S cluster assembly scaffold protein SufB
LIMKTATYTHAMPDTESETWRKLRLGGMDPSDYQPCSHSDLQAGSSTLISSYSGESAEEEQSDISAPSWLQLPQPGISVYNIPNPGRSPELPADLPAGTRKQTAELIERLSTADNRLHENLWQNLAQLQLVVVDDNMSLKDPLLLTTAAPANMDDRSLNTATIVLVGSNCTCNIVDEMAQSGELQSTALISLGRHISIGENSRVHYTSLDGFSQDAFVYQKLTSDSAASSRLSIWQYIRGGLRSKYLNEASIHGKDAYLDMDGALVLAGRSVCDYDARIFHNDGPSFSNILFKTGLTGRSHSIFSGNLITPSDVQGVEAAQMNRNLLLSDGARCESIPRLEVEPEHINCSHGASIGFLNDDQIYYLMCRGLSRDDAEKLLLQAFFTEILDKLMPAGLREAVMHSLRDHLHLYQ